MMTSRERAEHLVFVTQSVRAEGGKERAREETTGQVENLALHLFSKISSTLQFGHTLLPLSSCTARAQLPRKSVTSKTAV